MTKRKEVSTMKHWTDNLGYLGACQEAVEWARDYKSLAAAWAACLQGDWMIWLAGWTAGRLGSNAHRVFVLATCECTRLARYHSLLDLDSATGASDLAEQWARRRRGIKLSDVRAAIAAADSASAGAPNAYALAAAVATTVTASRMARPAAAANAIIFAANASPFDARARILSDCADILRQYYPTPPNITKSS